MQCKLSLTLSKSCLHDKKKMRHANCLSNWGKKRGPITEEITACLGKVSACLFPPRMYMTQTAPDTPLRAVLLSTRCCQYHDPEGANLCLGCHWELTVGITGSFRQVSEHVCISEEGIGIVSVLK